MKRALKFLTAITLSFLLVFGSSLGAFAAAKNTSIHLHADGNTYTVFVILEGNFSSNGVYDSEKNETTVPLLGGSLYKSTDFSIDVQPFVRYFIINGERWDIPANIKEGKEGSGTINYWMTDMPTKNVYYHKNNTAATGAEPVDSYNYFFGETVEVMSKGNLALEGYTFEGWNTKSDGLGTTYIAGNTFDMPANDVHLYAVWKLIPPTFNVIYHANNGDATGSVPVDSNDYHEDDTATVLGNTGNLVVSGYSFEGWNTETDGSGITYVAGNTFEMPGEDVHLYAVWELIPPTFNVIYHANNGVATGSVPVDSNDYHEDDSATVLGNTGNLVVPGHSFEGWNTETDGSGIIYVAGNTFEMPGEDVHLYAVWELIPTYSLTYDGNGATSGTAPAPQKFYPTGTEVTVLGNSGGFEISGLYFNGWNTDASGEGTFYAPGQKLTIGTTNIILYAQWSRYAPINGTITIQKIITGDTPLNGEIFEFRIIGYDGEESYVYNELPIYLSGGGSYVEYDVPVGMYHVEEINIPDDYELKSDNPQDALIGLEIGFNPIVRFENEYTEPLGSITVIKALVGDTPPSNATFTFRLVGPSGEGSTTRDLSRTGTGSVTFSGLSYGTYTLTELGLPSNYTVESGNNVQLSIHDETPSVTATITNRYTTPPTPPPPPPTPDRGTVRVHHVDTEDNLLDPIFELSGTVGTNYNTGPREYEDLELVETPENASGVFIDGTIDVFYVYSPGEEPVILLETEVPLAAPKVPEEIILIEPIPLAPLPQTGQLPAELFYGLGSMISMIGVAFRKGRKSR